MKAYVTRSAILAAAVEQGSLGGLEELSIGGLASTVKMSKSGLFAHFGSKQELQLATVSEAWEIFEAEVLRDPRYDPERALTTLLERWLSFYEQRVFAGGCFFVLSAVEFAYREDAVSDALHSAVGKQTAALEAAVRRANESGELLTRKDPSQTAFVLFSTLVSTEHLFHLHGDPEVFERARATIRAVLV